MFNHLPATTRAYLGFLFADAGRVELRHQSGRRWTTSWHQDTGSLLAAAEPLRSVGNLFTSLHHVSVDRVPGPARIAEPITNEDVDRYCRIFFDLDPERPTDTASTDLELQAAKDRAIGLRNYLLGHGWPVPATGVSGNGVHLQYRTALPNTQEHREQLREIYAGLHTRFSDDMVHFDRTVRNPGRIAPLYGTVKRKGKDTTERPHRQSSIVIPQHWQQVRPQQISRIADRFAAEHKRKAFHPGTNLRSADMVALAKGSGDYRTLDVLAWFTSHDLYVSEQRGGVHGVRCPWSDEHSTTSPQDGGDTVVFESDGGWPGFHCKHSHCEHRTIRDVIALLGDADRFCTGSFKKEVRHV